jgi:hypothetical protein
MLLIPTMRYHSPPPPPPRTGDPPRLWAFDLPHQLPAVVDDPYEQDPWEDLASVRAAFSPSQDGRFVLVDLEPAFVTRAQLQDGDDLDVYSREFTLELLADVAVRPHDVAWVAGWLAG